MIINDTFKLMCVGVAIVLVSALRFFYPSSKAEEVSEEIIERVIKAETGVDIDTVFQEEKQSDQ